MCECVCVLVCECVCVRERDRENERGMLDRALAASASLRSLLTQVLCVRGCERERAREHERERARARERESVWYVCVNERERVSQCVCV